MTLHYSKTTGGFYAEDVHGEAIPSDAVEVTPEDHAALMAAQAAGKRIVAASDGSPIAIDPPPPTRSQAQARLEGVVQSLLDSIAQGLGYDSMQSAVSYADEPSVAVFQAQGKALRAWRSQVWLAAIATLDAVNAGTAQVPSAAQLVASLPVFVAP